MKRPWLGQISVATERPLPFLGQRADKYYCIKTEPNRSQVKLEFEKRGLTCVNTWGSPPGIYPGIPDCGPDGKPVGCEPPPSPRMSGREHHHEMGRGQNCCRVPGTQERPCFTYNPTTQRCGNDWMDTSNADWPECVPAPPGYGGAYISPNADAGAGGGGATPSGTSCPPGQFWDGRQCRGSVGTMPGMGTRVKPGGRTRLGQAGQGWIPPSCAPAQPPPGGGGGGGGGGGSSGGGGGGSTYPVVNGCTDIPAKYKPLPGGGVAVGGAVLACKKTNGNYDVFSYTDGGPALFTDVTPTCLQQFGDVTMAQEGDTRCQGPQTSPTTGPCRLPTDKKYVVCPPSNGITADYYLEAETGHYAPNMTTQSPECRNNPNVIQVGAESPYCGGGEVSGSGEQYPSLVACWKQAGATGGNSNLVDVHNGPDMALLASNITVGEIPTRFPGRKWIVVMDNHCSALPNFGQSSAAPAPTPTPTPTPPPPTGIPVSNTGAPPTTNTQPSYESGPPVLPPRQNMTSPAIPTGAWPGAPFPAMPPIQPPIKATGPAPRPPEACPLGPVPIAKWAQECALSKKK